MPDPIAPPVARRAEEALELVSQAFSDGDLDAALAQYEPSAQLQPWARPTTAGSGLLDTMRELMDLRLPLSLSIRETLQVSGLTVVMCERRIAGIGPDCERIRLRGYGFAAVRPQPDGGWRIAIDSWCLEHPPEPPEVPPPGAIRPLCPTSRGRKVLRGRKGVRFGVFSATGPFSNTGAARSQDGRESCGSGRLISRSFGDMCCKLLIVNFPISLGSAGTLSYPEVR